MNMKNLIVAAVVVLFVIAGVAVYLMMNLNKPVPELTPIYEPNQVKEAQKPVETKPPVAVRAPEPVKPAPAKAVPMATPEPSPALEPESAFNQEVLPLPMPGNENVKPLPEFKPITNSTGPVPPEGFVPPTMEFPKELPKMTEEEMRNGPPVPPGYVVKPLPAFTPQVVSGGPGTSGTTDNSSSGTNNN